MKIFTKKRMQRFLVILLVVILTMDVAAPGIVVPVSEAAGVGGILMAPVTFLIAAILFSFQTILNFSVWAVEEIATSGGAGSPTDADVFITDIVFGKLKMVNANIFDTNIETANPLFVQAASAGSGTTTGGMLGVVQKWYGVTRIIAIAASLVTLIYVAIKIILASTGADKAKYMSLLKDWLMSLLLIFSIHYVMSAILFASQGITDFFCDMAGQEGFSYDSIRDSTLACENDSIIYALVWGCMLIYTFVMLLLYLKRLVLICFFVTISPIVILLSTINKLRGQGGRVLDTWLKSFIANVATQPIDALLFSIVASSIKVCADNGQPLISMAFVLGFFPLRSWMTQFFDQEAKENSTSAARGLVAAGAGFIAGKASNLAMKGKGGNGGNVGAPSNVNLGAGDGGDGGAGSAGGTGTPLAAANNAAATAALASAAGGTKPVSAPSSYGSSGEHNAAARIGTDYSNEAQHRTLGDRIKATPGNIRNGILNTKDNIVAGYMAGGDTKGQRLATLGKKTLSGAGKGAANLAKYGTAATLAGMAMLAGAGGGSDNKGKGTAAAKNMFRGVTAGADVVGEGIRNTAVTARDFIAGGAATREMALQEITDEATSYNNSIDSAIAAFAYTVGANGAIESASGEAEDIYNVEMTKLDGELGAATDQTQWAASQLTEEEIANVAASIDGGINSADYSNALFDAAYEKRQQAITARVATRAQEIEQNAERKRQEYAQRAQQVSTRAGAGQAVREKQQRERQEAADQRRAEYKERKAKERKAAEDQRKANEAQKAEHRKAVQRNNRGKK